uniref:Thymidine kinase n=4 Tax=Lygus hesperus TaxID=30085 RepID=A0A0A9WWZ4_LYGHE
MTGLKKKGKLQVVFGPMFSGKTSELIRRVQRYNLAGYRCLVVRYTHDNRYSTDSVATHDGMALNAILTSKLCDISHLVEPYDVIGIDEGQFFPDIVEFCEAQSDSGKKVVVAALDGTYQRAAFGRVLGLIPLAEEVLKLNSICMSCSAEAPFTKRIGRETEVEVIGGAEKYMSVCQDCYVSEPTIARSPFKNLRPPAYVIPINLL